MSAEDEALEPTVEAGGWKLTPVTTTRCHCARLGGLVHAHGRRRVVAVIVERDGKRQRLEVPQS